MTRERKTKLYKILRLVERRLDFRKQKLHGQFLFSLLFDKNPVTSNVIGLKNKAKNKKASVINTIKKHPGYVAFETRGRGVQHKYMNFIYLMGDKFYFFFPDDSAQTTYEDICNDIDILLETVNLLTVLRFLKLLINPFYTIGQIFFSEILVVSNKDLSDKILNYLKKGQKLWFFDYYYYSSKGSLFLSFLLYDFVSFLFYKFGIASAMNVLKSVCKVTLGEYVQDIYRFMAFLVLLDKISLKQAQISDKDKSTLWFLSSYEPQSEILDLVGFKLPFKIDFDTYQNRDFHVSLLLSRVVKRYFFVKDHFDLVFGQFKRRYIDFVLQYRALSLLMLSLSRSKNYVLWSLYKEMLFFRNDNLDTIGFLLGVQKMDICFQLADLKAFDLMDAVFTKRAELVRVNKGNGNGIGNAGESDELKKGRSFCRSAFRKVGSNIRKFKSNLGNGIIQLNNVKGNVRAARIMSRVKIQPRAYRLNRGFMVSRMQSYIFGLPRDLIFLNFLNLRRIKRFTKFSFVNHIELSGGFTRFIFLDDFDFLVVNKFIGLVEKLGGGSKGGGKHPVGRKIYMLGNTSINANNVFFSDFKHILFATSNKFSYKLFIMFITSLTFMDLLSVLKYTRYVLSRGTVSSFLFFVGIVLYCLFLAFLVFILKIIRVMTHGFFLYLEAGIAGILLTTIFWLKYSGILCNLCIMLFFIFFCVGFCFVLYKFMAFLFHRCLIRLFNRVNWLLRFVLFILTTYKYSYYSLFVLNNMLGRKFRLFDVIMPLLSVGVYIRESYLIYIAGIHWVTNGFVYLVYFVVHFARKFGVLSFGLKDFFITRLSFILEFSQKSYNDPLFQMFVLNGGDKFIYKLLDNNVLYTEHVFSSKGGMALFFEVIFHQVLTLFFWIIMLMILIVRQLLIFFVYVFMCIYSLVFMVINYGIDHISIYARFLYGKLHGVILFVVFKIILLFNMMFNRAGLLKSDVFFDDLRYWTGNNLLGDGILSHLNAVEYRVRYKGLFNFGYFFLRKPFKRRVGSKYFDWFDFVITVDNIWLFYDYTGVSFDGLLLDMVFFRYKKGSLNFVFKLVKAMKRGLFMTVAAPRLFTEFVDGLLRLLLLTLKVYYRVMLKHLDFNVVYLNYIYSLRDQLGAINGILLTHTGFPFWGRGRLFFPSLKFNRSFYLFNSLVEVFEDISKGKINFYPLSLHGRSYFGSLVFFWDILWSRFRVDVSSIFKLLSSETMIDYFKDYYYYGILPFNLFKMRSNVLFFVDINVIGNYVLDIGLTANANLHRNAGIKRMWNIRFVPQFFRMIAARVFFAVGFFLYCLGKLFKCLFLVLLGFLIVLPLVVVTYLVFGALKVLIIISWRVYKRVSLWIEKDEQLFFTEDQAAEADFKDMEDYDRR